MKQSGSLFQKTLFISFVFFTIGAGHAFSQDGSADSFCQTFKALIESGSNGFETIKGAETTRVITGSPKKFFISTTSFNDSIVGYINDVSSYPEYECIIAKDTRISNKLTANYTRHKSGILDCFSEGWAITEQDSTNNFYLKGTKFKKLVGIQKTDGKKMKFHLYMYSSMIEKNRIIELKIEGIGKQN